MPDAFPHDTETGLTKREYVATQLLAALILKESPSDRTSTQAKAKYAAEHADALLTEVSE